MISALCSCQNVLVMNQTADTERGKMIGENDCYGKNKLALLYFGMFVSISMTNMILLSFPFTKMYSLRPSLKMLHEIF